MELLEGLRVANKYDNLLRDKFQEEISKGNRVPQMAIINVGNNPASASYIKGKRRSAEEVGIQTVLYEYDSDVSQKTILERIEKLNANDNVDGIILQLPLPSHLSTSVLINAIDVDKDIDGLTFENAGKLFKGMEGIIPATPKGIVMLLNEYKINVSGMNIVIIGRSQLVGMPLSKVFTDLDATVTLCHSKTVKLVKHTRLADMIVVAVGVPNMLIGAMVKKGVIILDVGINVVDGKLIGDVNFNSVAKKASYITPVPKGIGPMTISGLLENTYLLYKRHLSNFKTIKYDKIEKNERNDF